MTDYSPPDPNQGYYNPAYANPNPRPASVTTLAVIGIILASISILNHAVGLAMLAAGGPVGVAGAGLQGWAVVDSVISLTFAVFLLIACISALRLRQWARSGLVIYAVAYLIWLGICGVVLVSWTLPAMEDQVKANVAGQPQGTADIAVATMYIAGLGVFALAAIYPIFLLVFMRKPHVRAAFGESVSSGSGGFSQQYSGVAPPQPPPSSQYMR